MSFAPIRPRTLALVAAAAVSALVVALLPATAPSAQANHAVHERGYIPVAVGTPEETTLHYRVSLPDPEVWGPGPYPAVVDYSGYIPAITIYDGLDHRFTEHGYAVVGLNMRGSACSGGQFDYFEWRQALDGAEALDWLAENAAWSDGRFGMVGKSYPGISQLFVAAAAGSVDGIGDSLKTIVPGHVFGDLYRDVPYPGGVLNITFAAAWSGQRLQESYLNGPQWALETGDEQCMENQPDHAPNVVLNPIVRGAATAYDGPLYWERSPWWWAERIQVPTFLINAWQDEQVGSRSTHLLDRLETTWRFLGTNGDHGEYYGQEVFPHIIRFLSYYLKEEIPEGDRFTVTETRQVLNPSGRAIPGRSETVERNATFEEALEAYESEDPVIVNWENGAHGGRNAAWSATYDAWPPSQQEAWRLHLRDDGSMTEDGWTAPVPWETPLDAIEARRAGAVDYLYAPAVGSEQRGGVIDGPPGTGWGGGTPPATSATFETDALERDAVLLGSASVDLWFTSTAPDTDIAVTISEVRPDGQEMFIQQGWLRASQRHEDARFSTELRPFQTHRQGDVAPITPGHAAKLRIEVFPFGHVLREGSKLRLTVAAPHAWPDYWGFAARPGPAVNTIFTSAFHPSSIALPLLAGEEAGADLPPCTLRNQPCRDAS